MTTHSERRVVAASREAIFDLVADVERYPEFLPLWRSARIVHRGENSYDTEQRIGLGIIHERFRTRTILHRPHHIRVVSNDDIFERFRIAWDFADAREGAQIAIALEWAVRSRPLQKGIDIALPGVAKLMVSAFESRARQAALPLRRVRHRPSIAG